MSPARHPARLEAVVRGRVQGVGFRHFVKVTARALALKGVVRNTPRGTVELVAEGPRPALESLEAALQHGPPAAHVDAVEARWGPPTGAFERFSVDLG